MNTAMRQPSDLPDVLRDIVNLNFEFRERVANGDWAGATELENQRRAELQDLFDRPLEPDVRQRVISTLNELLQSDRTLVRDLEAARDLCSNQISQLQLGRKAATAYQDTDLMLQSPKMMQ